MDADFWLQRWNEGRIGFHRGEVMPLLEKHWPGLNVPADGRVFVPLAGKSLDMHWLAAQGHRVLGAELSPLAVQAFFAEAGLEPVVANDADGVHHRAGEKLFVYKSSVLKARIFLYARTPDGYAVPSLCAAYEAYHLGASNIEYGGILFHFSSIAPLLSICHENILPPNSWSKHTTPLYFVQ